jgi:K+-transporting ATPase ATPase B chain
VIQLSRCGPRGQHYAEASTVAPQRERERERRTAVKPGDKVVVEASQIIPGDGDVIEGGAVVNEAAITGESAPVIREAGGDRSGVTGGTTVLSDRIVVRISAGPGESFLDQMIALVEGARCQRTPNEIALTLVLTAFTLIFMIVVVPLWPMAWNAEQYMTSYLGLSDPLKSLGTDVPTLVALIVCLIPTTIGALLAAIGIAGMDRALRANIIAKSGKAVDIPEWNELARLAVADGDRAGLVEHHGVDVASVVRHGFETPGCACSGGQG